MKPLPPMEDAHDILAGRNTCHGCGEPFTPTGVRLTACKFCPTCKASRAKASKKAYWDRVRTTSIGMDVLRPKQRVKEFGIKRGLGAARSQQEVADILGVSFQAVGQVESRALSKCEKLMRAKGLDNPETRARVNWQEKIWERFLNEEQKAELKSWDELAAAYAFRGQHEIASEIRAEVNRLKLYVSL